MDPHSFEASATDADRCKFCDDFRSADQHQAWPPRGYVDCRNERAVFVFDQCKCGQQYTMNIMIPHQCPDCNRKWLYPPDGVKPVPLWQQAWSFLQSLWKK